MPRAVRVQYPGAIYHVMSRGDRREDIFLDDVDRQDFLKTLAEACQKAGFEIHAYCLMRNHFHLVLETPNANLVAGMAWFLSTYTIRFNHRHKLFGHVLSGRYKAQLVEGSGTGYLRTACDYVHLNPVRARMLQPEERLLSYPWSSFGAYLAAPEHRPGWVRVDRLLGEHGIREDTPAGRQRFEQWMERRRAEEAGVGRKRIWTSAGRTIRTSLRWRPGCVARPPFRSKTSRCGCAWAPRKAPTPICTTTCGGDRHPVRAKCRWAYNPMQSEKDRTNLWVDPSCCCPAGWAAAL